MSAAANVVALFSRSPRKNRRVDDETIRTRRLLAAMQRAASGCEDTAALALSYAMERKLPRNQLRLLAGTKDERRDLGVRLQDVEIARAEYKAAEARRRRARILHGDDAMREMDGEGQAAFDRFRQAVIDMANTRAFTKRDMASKRAAIGTVWLGADGPWYDALRAALAADEARLLKQREA